MEIQTSLNVFVYLALTVARIMNLLLAVYSLLYKPVSSRYLVLFSLRYCFLANTEDVFPMENDDYNSIRSTTPSDNIGG